MGSWAYGLIGTAGLMGAAGVALAAAGAHAGGANLTTAATFLLLHAGVVAALGLHGEAASFLVAGTLLTLGACLFAGDLASRTWLGAPLFPMAAPAGGLTMILGWLALSGAALLGALGRA